MKEWVERKFQFEVTCKDHPNPKSSTPPKQANLIWNECDNYRKVLRGLPVSTLSRIIQFAGLAQDGDRETSVPISTFSTLTLSLL